MARYSGNLGKWVRGEAVTPAASASRDASGDSGWLNSEEFATLVLTLDVTGDNFTTLDVDGDTASDDQGTDLRTVGSFTQAAGVTAERLSFPGLDKFYRVAWTLVGTDATFSVAGEAK